MTWSLSVNGTDLASLGFYLQESEGVFDAVDRDWPQIPVHGRAGVLFGSPAREGTRRITLTGLITTTAKTVEARVAAEDQLKDLLRAGLIRIVRDDGFTTDREIEGYAKRIGIKQVGHPLDATDSFLTCTVETVDAYWRDSEPTIRHLIATGTRYTLPLGTAPSTPIIRIMGSGTNPVLTYRDAGGLSIKTLTITATLGAGDFVDIDMRVGKIVQYTSGTPGATPPAFTGDFTWALDPQDGNYTLSAWPTIEVSTGGNVAVYYWKSWQ